MTRPRAVGKGLLRIREAVLGIAAICVAMLALGGCQPGGSSGDGIDPGIIEIPIAFIKRPVPRDDMGSPLQPDMREPLLFTAGGDVFVRSSTAVGASLSNISLAVTGGSGDVKGLNASADGSKLIFSLRLFDEDPDDDIVPSWNIYEFDLGSNQIRAVITDALTAEAGDDLFPAYLPDGRIVFTSNRQKQSGQNLINEGKPGYRALVENGDALAMVLHVMNADGSGLRQISFNQSHDLYPQVLTQTYPGKIVFSRWDKAVEDKAIHLYTINPDGSELELLYGLNSHFSGSGGAEIQFGNSRETENGELMLITRPYSGTFDGGNIELIDVGRFVDNDKPLWSLAGLTGPAQKPVTINPVVNDGSLSVAGRYSSAFPLWDGSSRILVSKSTCQLDLDNELRPCAEPYLSDPAAVEASPSYAIWLYDAFEETEKPVVLAEPGMVITEVVAMSKREAAPIIFDNDAELDSAQLDAKVGVVNIKSVYDMGNGEFDGCYFGYCTTAPNIESVQDFADPLNATAAQRPARFVRFIKPVGLPARNDPSLANPPAPNGNAFGPRRALGMREIVGYAPVEPDGSVKIRVPANIPLALEVLDAAGRRIGPMHFNWFQVRAGDTLTCNGCHIHDSGGAGHETHGRVDAGAPSINVGLPAGLQFVNTLIPGTATPYWGNFGETMAEVRFDRIELASPPVVEPQLSVDLLYDDYWTDTAVRPADASYAYRYADLDGALASPANNFCTPWKFNCRSVINYPEHIHAIWQLDRGVDLITPDAPANPVNNNDPTNTPLVPINTPNLVGDDTCTECHTTRGGTRLPYAQLDLTSDPAQNPNQLYRSYRQLFSGRAGQTFDGMALVPITRLVPDGMGGVVEEVDPAARVRPTMSGNGARASYFIEKMTGTELDANRPLVAGSVDHTGMLSAAELKLISEWLDLGAQNFNDLFDPDLPQN